MPNARTKAFAAACAVVVAAVLALVPVTSASAHDYLVSSTPAAGSTVTTPPATVSLTFNDLVLDLTGDGASSVLEVTGPDGASTHYETGCPTVLGRTLSAPVALGAAGTYQVSWQIVSSDGHPVASSISFTYAPAAGSQTDTAAQPGSATAPACGTAVSTGAAVPPGSTTDPSSTGVNAWLIIGIAGGIVLLAIVGVVIVVVLSRRPAVAEPGARVRGTGGGSDGDSGGGSGDGDDSGGGSGDDGDDSGGGSGSDGANGVRSAD